MTILMMLHNLLKNGNIVAGGTPAYQAGEDEGVDLMDLETNPKTRAFCNNLKYKDNSKCRLEAGAPRNNFFNTLEDACAPHGHG